MKYFLILVTVLTVCLLTPFASAQDKVVVVPLGKSGLKAVNDTSPCDASRAGTVRWTGTQFEGCNGTDWIVLTMPYGTVTSATGRVWMDRDLGASRVATSQSDSAAFGDLYQWGRLTDGHEQRTSTTNPELISTDVPGHGFFILATTFPYDWRSPQNNTLWQGVSGINNPCPAGFRLPTEGEWETERLSWSSYDAAGAFDSPLKLVKAGYRGTNGTLTFVGSVGNYWSSTVDGNNSRVLSVLSDNSYSASGNRAAGVSVRCIKD